MKRVLWSPAKNYSGGEKHCGNCAHSIRWRARAEKCNGSALVIDNKDGTVTVISKCSGQKFVYPIDIIERN